MEDLLGPSLVSGSKTVATKDALPTSGVVALLFSASWCGPCRSFEPVLKAFYEKVRGAGKDFEVVFVSSDRDQASYDEYFGGMPWLSLPFDDKDRKGKLSSKMKVQGIPTLVLVDAATGEAFDKKGREVVMRDPEGAEFPWAPPTMQELLGDEFLASDGSTVGFEALAGKHITLLFSAHWCPPCRQTTPKVVEVYKKLAEKNADWVVLFISSDKDQAAFDEYFAEMPWHAVPFADRARKERLSAHFDVEGIPTLIMLDPELNVSNKAARGAIVGDPEGKDFPWAPKPVQKLSAGAGEINGMPALVVLMESEGESTQAQFGAVLADLAEQHLARVKAKTAEPMLFLMADSEDGVAARIRELCKLDKGALGEAGAGAPKTLCNGDMCMKLDASTVVVLLNIPDSGGYYQLAGDMTNDNMAAFVQSFVDEELADQRKQLGE